MPDGPFEADMRVGGTFRQAMRCRGDLHVAHGEYRKIVPGKEVAFTHQWEEEDPVETLVNIRFKPTKGGTEIVLSQTGFKDVAEARGHKDGWSSALASFAKVSPRGAARGDRRPGPAEIKVGVRPRL